jgi:integrase
MSMKDLQGGRWRDVGVVVPLKIQTGSNSTVALKNAGVAWHGFYSLRRGVGTAVAALSRNSLAAKGLLRHASVSTTQRHYYIKDAPETTLQAMKQLGTLRNPRPTAQGTKPS